MSNAAADLTLVTRREDLDRMDVPADIGAVLIVRHPDGTQCVVSIEALRHILGIYDHIKERS